MTFLLALMPWLIGLSMVAVLGVLFTGVLAMGQGGDDQRRRSNVLMRWRVVSQLVTVALIALYALLRNAL